MRNQSFFANPSFRVHLLWVCGGFCAALLAAGGAALFIPLFQRFDAGVGSPDEMLRLTGEILELHARYWPVAAVALLATLGCAWLLHARMRGPLFRFVAAFRALAAGRVPEAVVIRATDYVQEFTKEIPKAKVLTTAAVLKPGRGAPNGRTVRLDDTLEGLLPALLDDESEIWVEDPDGRTVGVIDRQAVAKALEPDR